MKLAKKRDFIVMVVTVVLLGVCAALSGIFPRPQLVMADVQSVMLQEELCEQDLTLGEVNDFEEVQYPIVVHVAGEVELPGVYVLNKDSRVLDAVEAAGGMSKNAAKDRVNLAMPISDGQQIYIPTVSEVEPREIKEPKDRLAVTEDNVISTKEALLVDINKANLEELSKLPGIGKVTAANIISYRESSGKFNSIGELINVSGIGAAKLEKIYPYVKVN